MAVEYYFERCWICHRPGNKESQPNICNRCTAEGWEKSPHPDPEYKFGFLKTLWYLMTYKDYRKVPKGLTKN